MEAGETVLDSALRETYEEVGSGVQVRPLGTVHVSTFHYDERVQFMLSIAYLFAYQDGDIQPGDDMAGSEYHWWSLDEMDAENIEIIVPQGEKWILSRAIDLYRLWVQGNADDLPGFNLSIRGK